MKGNIFVDESVKAKGRPRNMLSVPVLRERVAVSPNKALMES